MEELNLPETLKKTDRVMKSLRKNALKTKNN